MRKTLGVFLLVLLLAGSASADIMPNGFTSNGVMPNGSSDPTSPQSATAVQTTTDGEMHTDVAASLTQVALSVLAVLPSLP
jgi:hypothetical protein